MGEGAAFRPGWYVLQTAPARELRAQAAALELGLEAWMPCETRWASHGRKRSRVSRPLFPRYLFVNVEAGGLYQLRRVDGVERVITGTGGQPRPIDGAWIRRMMQAEGLGDFDATRPAARAKHKPGDSVVMIGGRFDGMPARFVRKEAGERVRVLFSILGGLVPLQLADTEIRAA